MNDTVDTCINFSNNLFISAFLISLVISQDLSTDEQNLLGSYLQIIGQNLTSIAVFNDYCKLENENGATTN